MGGRFMSAQLLLAMFVLLPAATLLVSAARPVRVPFMVHGKVYCDTCQAGFETTATTYLPGASVKLQCKNRDTLNVVYTDHTVTDAEGAYKFQVAFDHEDEICECVLVKSSQSDCAKVSPGRDSALVILTNNNGISSNVRYANNLGFVQAQPMAACTEVLKQYDLTDQYL